MAKTFSRAQVIKREEGKSLLFKDVHFPNWSTKSHTKFSFEALHAHCVITKDHGMQALDMEATHAGVMEAHRVSMSKERQGKACKERQCRCTVLHGVENNSSSLWSHESCHHEFPLFFFFFPEKLHNSSPLVCKSSSLHERCHRSHICATTSLSRVKQKPL